MSTALFQLVYLHLSKSYTIQALDCLVVRPGLQNHILSFPHFADNCTDYGMDRAAAAPAAALPLPSS